MADLLLSKIGRWLLQLQLRGQRRSSYILHSHSQFQTSHEPTLRTSPISPLDKDSYCRRGRNTVALQIHTGRGSTAGGICILPQSYFLVLIAETLGHILMGEFVVSNAVCYAAWLLVKTSFVGDNPSQQNDTENYSVNTAFYRKI